MSGAAAVVLQAVKSLLSRVMDSADWRLHGLLQVESIMGKGRWMVSTPRSDPVRLEHVPTKRNLVVPFSAMEMDFASVPALAQRIGVKALHLRPRDYERAAFLHDQLYAAGWCWATEDGVAVKVPVSKKQSDAILFVALECSGATWADGLAYHSAVHLFGRKAWKRCRKQGAEWPELFAEVDPCAK